MPKALKSCPKWKKSLNLFTLLVAAKTICDKEWKTKLFVDSRRSYVVSSAPTILWPRVQIPTTPSYNFYNWDCNEKRTKINKQSGRVLTKFVVPSRKRKNYLWIRLQRLCLSKKSKKLSILWDTYENNYQQDLVTGNDSCLD